MPNFRPDTIESWLYAKILAAVLLEKLASPHSGVFSPIDYELEFETERVGLRETALEADSTTLALARVRALADVALGVRSQSRSCL
jgi:hypothetical protein